MDPHIPTYIAITLVLLVLISISGAGIWYFSSLIRRNLTQLIDEVHTRLTGPAGDALAARLQQSWPVALIDEFQDTDARQWAIFDRVWRGAGPGGRALILIGDPKQAIYGFRGGDVARRLGAPPKARHGELRSGWEGPSISAR